MHFVRDAFSEGEVDVGRFLFITSLIKKMEKVTLMPIPKWAAWISFVMFCVVGIG